ncbi:manganese transport system membrane protein MntD [Thiomicrorhabdus immobilis]|uniref:Manganese transport system membrane protein MntD n=1 Tax=Thiomicrorhabdus immobilis TaxID=2791037 RepID=A0ABN6CX88_9GAMM|nr:metal ABC transporter permease [Thiomicrorhabdus immobilis]BCN93745.1 manganese transport system membrane protein MntD [Thiomicrorhabdus immobilis]
MFAEFGINDIWILATASLVAASTSMIGVFLILRKQALIGDAISHSVLLGIVLAFLLTESRSLPVMLTGAVFIGLLTAWLSDTLHRVGKLQSDASIGIIFTLFFALGVILVSLYAGQIDLDQECVLYGEIAFVPFDTIYFGGTENGVEIGPRAFWGIGIVFLIVLLSIVVAFKRLETIAFHPSLAISLGINVVFWHYFLMTLVSMTTVASFDAVGAILVVALLVIPASSAYLLAKSLKTMLWIAVAYSQAAVLIGYSLAYQLDSSISASIAVSAGLLLFATIVILQINKKRKQSQSLMFNVENPVEFKSK